MKSMRGMTRTRRLRIAALLGTIGVFASVGAAPPAGAASGAKAPSAPNSSCYPSGGSFHCYAIGWDNTHGPYDGIGVTRNDINISGIAAGSNCAGVPGSGWSISGGVAYQSQWITLAGAQGQDWEELGTGHRCDYENFWYWGYGLNGAWYPLGTENQSYIGPNAQHRFSIYRTGNTWHYEIDNTVMGATADWGTTTGTSIQFGLESWDAGASTTGQPYSDISYLSSGTSHAISGRQGTTIDPWMCGQWSSDTEWWAGEGAGCGYKSSSVATSADAQAAPAPAAAAQAALPLSGTARIGGGLTSSQLVTSCGTNARTATDQWGQATSVLRAYGSSAKSVTDWKTRYLGKTGKTLDSSQVDAAGPVAVCVIAGDYKIPTPPPAQGSTTPTPTFDLAVVTVDSHGTVKPFAYGNATTLAGLLGTAPAQ